MSRPYTMWRKTLREELAAVVLKSPELLNNIVVLFFVQNSYNFLPLWKLWPPKHQNASNDSSDANDTNIKSS